MYLQILFFTRSNLLHSFSLFHRADAGWTGSCIARDVGKGRKKNAIVYAFGFSVICPKSLHASPIKSQLRCNGDNIHNVSRIIFLSSSCWRNAGFHVHRRFLFFFSSTSVFLQSLCATNIQAISYNDHHHHHHWEYTVIAAGAALCKVNQVQNMPFVKARARSLQPHSHSHINILNVRQIWKENILWRCAFCLASHRFVHVSISSNVHSIRFDRSAYIDQDPLNEILTSSDFRPISGWFFA